MSTKVRKIALSFGLIGLCIPSLSQAVVPEVVVPAALALTGATLMAVGLFPKELDGVIRGVKSEWAEKTFGTRLGSETSNFDIVKKIIGDYYSNAIGSFSSQSNPETRLKNGARAILNLYDILIKGSNSLPAEVDAALIDQEREKIKAIIQNPRYAQIFAWADEGRAGIVTTVAHNVEDLAKNGIALHGLSGARNMANGKPTTNVENAAAVLALTGAKGDAPQAIGNSVGAVFNSLLKTGKAIIGKATEAIAGPDAVKSSVEIAVDKMTRNQKLEAGDTLHAAAIPVLTQGRDEFKNWSQTIRNVANDVSLSQPKINDSLESHGHYPTEENNAGSMAEVRNARDNSFITKISSLNQVTLLKGLGITMGTTLAAALIWRHRASFTQSVKNGVTYIKQKTASGATIVYEITCDGVARVKDFFFAPQETDESSTTDNSPVVYAIIDVPLV